MTNPDKIDYNKNIRPKVSVIIPVWNPGQGIRKCIRSLRHQTLKEIEMIFIDDCGSDGAMELVRRAAAADDRIRILSNGRNMGSGYSRNKGIEAARGVYLSFVDPDDYVAHDFLEKLYKTAKRRHLDIVKGKTVLLPGVKNDVFHGIDRVNLKIKLFRPLGIPLFILFNYGYWSALFRREYLIDSGSRFGSSRISQDTTFLLYACSADPGFGFESDACYYYVRRENSAVRRMDKSRLREQAKSLEEQLGYFQKTGRWNKYAVTYLRFRIHDNLRVCACAQQYPELKQEAELYLRRIRSLAAKCPGSGAAAGRSPVIRELIDHGVNLITGPYEPFGGISKTDNWRMIVRNWTDWVSQNPGEQYRQKKLLKKVYKDTALNYFGNPSEGEVKERSAQFLHALAMEAERIPDHKIRQEIMRSCRGICCCAGIPFLKRIVSMQLRLQAFGELFQKAQEFF